MKARQGPKKAIGAVQHAMLVAIWHMLSRQLPHADLGPDYLGRRDGTQANATTSDACNRWDSASPWSRPPRSVPN